MKKIKIINGTYGLRTDNGLTVECKDARSAPFLVDDGEAERLAARGVAVVIEASTETFCSTREQEAPKKAKIEYSDEMKLDQLKELAAEIGISETDLKKMRSKKAVIAALDAALGEESDAEDYDEGETAPYDGDPLPELGAADPV